MGYLRFVLSLAVTAAHMTGRHSMLATCAVWVFYLLSGYLMALLCAGPYRGRWGAFWASRLLRIFPAYWMVMAATTWGIWAWGHSATFPLLALPVPHEWLLLNVQTWWGGFEGPRNVVPAWSLTVELFWWLLISLGLLAGRRSLAWMAGGAALTVAGAYPLGPLWFSLWGGMLPFALGAWLFERGLTIPRDGAGAAIAGALSYPVYIVHYSAGAGVAGLLGLSMGWPLFWASLPVTLALSRLLLALERPVTEFRKTLRS